METKKLKLNQEDRSSMIIGLRVSLRKRYKDTVYHIPSSVFFETFIGFFTFEKLV
jgi:hypothetical protein